ncbi:MAG TPA: tRNA lysidine(34) synthetase TilS [Actinomycetota bacterium]|nr:tRNA lysidine(34) synthetase TilS [Actinomycetota bacterium]
MFLRSRVASHLGRSKGAGSLAGSNRLTHPAAISARTIDQHRMIQTGQKVLVAFSGGPDSTALMLILRELGYPLHLCHVDHQMRPESARDGAHCIAVAEALNIGITVRKAEPPVLTEAAARKARYEILEAVAERVSADVIATGHTKDDQAETVKLRLDRGGFGLGIPPTRGRIVRPIIELSKSDATTLCDDAGVEFVRDPSNEDLKYARNRIRQELQGDPEQTEDLLRIGAQAREEVESSSDRLESAIGNTIFFEDYGAAIDRSWIRGLARDDAQTFVSQTIRRLGFELRSASLMKIEDIFSATGKRLDIGDGLNAWTDAKWLKLGVLESPVDLPEVELAIPGSTVWGRALLSLQVHQFPSPHETMGELMDFGATGPRLWVRQWTPGDRFRPLGSGQKKLQDFFVDERVPRWERSKVPVVHNGTDIVWVGGMRIAEGYKVTPSTQKVLSGLLEHR